LNKWRSIAGRRRRGESSDSAHLTLVRKFLVIDGANLRASLRKIFDIKTLYRTVNAEVERDGKTEFCERFALLATFVRRNNSLDVFVRRI
jgi:hypothetical protein